MWNDDSDDIHKQGDADVRQRCAPATRNGVMKLQTTCCFNLSDERSQTMSLTGLW